MALFTDTDVITLDDLLQFESSLMSVCSTHAIDAQTKIRIARDAVGDRLMLWLLRSAQFDLNGATRKPLRLDNVVVNSSISRWLSFDALFRIFSEAYNVQLNTRFQGKMNEYQKQCQDAASLVYTAGLDIVNNPLSQPPLPLITVGVGSLSSSALFVQTTWVNALGQESAPSQTNGAVLSGFSSVSIGASADPSVAPTSALGWNVYAGESQSALQRQNQGIIPIGQAFAIPPPGLIPGPVVQLNGQLPDRHVVVAGLLQRG